MEKLKSMHIHVNEKGTVELCFDDGLPILFPYSNPHLVMERIGRFCLQLWHDEKCNEPE